MMVPNSLLVTLKELQDYDPALKQWVAGDLADRA